MTNKNTPLVVKKIFAYVGNKTISLSDKSFAEHNIEINCMLSKNGNKFEVLETTTNVSSDIDLSFIELYCNISNRSFNATYISEISNHIHLYFIAELNKNIILDFSENINLPKSYDLNMKPIKLNVLFEVEKFKNRIEGIIGDVINNSKPLLISKEHLYS